MQGYRIGKTLVITRFLRDGGLPAWHYDESCYSDSGEVVILKALDIFREIAKSLNTGSDMPFIVRKLELSINMKEPAPCP